VGTTVGITHDPADFADRSLTCLSYGPARATAVEDGGHTPARWITRLRAYPNPFNPHTQLSFELLRPSPINIDIIDLLRRRVRAVYTGHLAAGAHVLNWDGRDEAGRPAPSGSYQARVRAPGEIVAEPLLLLK
jgi:hypothetical protein